MFDLIQKIAARQQLSLLGGVQVSLNRPANSLPSVLALIERDIQVIAENGLQTEKRTVVSMLVEDVGDLKQGDEIVDGSDTFRVREIMQRDEFVIKVFVRG
jgi:hypothetical protein